jgi:chromosome segregation ATPase
MSEACYAQTDLQTATKAFPAGPVLHASERMPDEQTLQDATEALDEAQAAYDDKQTAANEASRNVASQALERQKLLAKCVTDEQLDRWHNRKRIASQKPLPEAKEDLAEALEKSRAEMAALQAKLDKYEAREEKHTANGKPTKAKAYTDKIPGLKAKLGKE